MARTKQFDPDDALDEALRCFKRYGFAGSSMAALTDAMGIGRQSVYATYGDKRALYLASLERYVEATAGYVDERLRATDDPVAEVRALLREIGRWAVDPEHRDGCFLVNSTAELASNDAEIRRIAARGFERLENAYHAALLRALEAGALPADKDPRALARFLVAQMQCIRLQAKANPDPAAIADVVEVALGVLD